MPDSVGVKSPELYRPEPRDPHRPGHPHRAGEGWFTTAVKHRQAHAFELNIKTPRAIRHVEERCAIGLPSSTSAPSVVIPVGQLPTLICWGAQVLELGRERVRRAALEIGRAERPAATLTEYRLEGDAASPKVNADNRAGLAHHRRVCRIGGCVDGSHGVRARAALITVAGPQVWAVPSQFGPRSTERCRPGEGR